MCILRRRREAGRGSALARTDGLSRGVPREDLVREALELVAHLIAAELALEVHGDVPLERDRDARAVDVRDAVRARAEKHLLDAVLEPARAGEDGGRDARGEGRGSQIADSSGGAGKGGVGKTTSSANLGMSMARLGYRVALIDADIGLRNLDLLLGLENRVMYTAMEVLEGECRMEQALIRDKRWRTLALLPISKNRARYNVTKNNMNTLIKVLKEMEFQYIIVDCPAGIDVGFINAISCADKAVIVTTPEITAIRDADRVAGLLEANGVYDVKLLVNRVRADMIKKNDMMSVKDVQEMLGVPLLGAIPEDTEVIVSTNRGEPLVLKKKLTLAGIAYENAARRISGKQDFLIDLDKPKKGVFQRVGEFFAGNEE